MLLGLAGNALAAASPVAVTREGLPIVSDAGSPAAEALLGSSVFSVTGAYRQHDGTDLHLPPAQQNMEVVSKLEMVTPGPLRTPETVADNVLPGQIADVSVHKGYAYLNSWDEPTCQRGGTFIVDINDPARPQQVGFIPALERRYHGEGAHVVTLNTPAFQGEVLAVNNEPYSSLDCTAPEEFSSFGGFDLYDVTNPRNPSTLVQGVGDTGPEGELEGDDETANSSHSTFVWQNDDRRAFVVFVDNTELHDVDIFEITDPRNPRPVAEFDLVEVAEAQGVDIVDNSALGNSIFLHDMVVKKIGGRYVMLANYWDAGYVTVDVTNPAQPKIIGDSSFGITSDDGRDPLTGFDPPEGNGHQAEFSHDNKYLLAADEDFGACRFDAGITSGPNADSPLIAAEGSNVPPLCPDNDIQGPVRFVGEACTAGGPIAPPDGIEIALIARGTCAFQEKYDNVVAAGYESGVVFNSNSTSNGCDALLSMLVDGDDIPFLFIPRSMGFQILGAYDEATYECTPGNNAETTPVPAAPQVGAEIEFLALFDGWGYAHLYEADVADDAGTDDMRRVDSYAIKEALNPAYAVGFGDLSIHEFATDPERNLAYSSYYSGGMRVFSFGEGGLTEQGKFIDQGGSNFWGVEQFTAPNGERLIAGSDRDFGLYILRYTGPNAVTAPQASAPPAATPARLADPRIDNRRLRVGKKRYVRVPVSCAETVGGDCRGRLSIERRNGWTTLAQRWFAKDANELSTVRLRLSRAEFRRLVRRRTQRVTVELITRGIDGQLRHAETRLTLLAPRR